MKIVKRALFRLIEPQHPEKETRRRIEEETVTYSTALTYVEIVR
jgi:hypothetical protein